MFCEDCQDKYEDAVEELDSIIQEQCKEIESLKEFIEGYITTDEGENDEKIQSE